MRMNLPLYSGKFILTPLQKIEFPPHSGKPILTPVGKREVGTLGRVANLFSSLQARGTQGKMSISFLSPSDY